jgi:hypothetical protein
VTYCIEGLFNDSYRPEGIIRGMTMANGMVEMEPHSSVYLPSGAPTKFGRLEKEAGASKNREILNPDMAD